MTFEFMKELKSHLTSNGVVIFNVITSLSGETSALFKAEYKTVKSTFPNVYVFPVSTENQNIVQNVEIVATNSDTFYSKSTLLNRVERYDSLGPPKFSEYVATYWEVGVDTADSYILTDDYAPVENLLNPMTGQPYIIEEAEGQILMEGTESFQFNRTDLRFDLNSFALIAIGVLIICLHFYGRKFAVPTSTTAKTSASKNSKKNRLLFIKSRR